MNIFKRVFLCLIAVLIFTLLVACNNKDEGDANTESISTAESQQSSVDDTNDTADINDTSDTQITDDESKSQESEDTAPDTDIRLGDDDKDWGSYNPIG